MHIEPTTNINFLSINNDMSPIIYCELVVKIL